MNSIMNLTLRWCLMLLLIMSSTLLAEVPVVTSFSWSSPDTQYFRLHADELEQWPFTGSAVTVAREQTANGNVAMAATDSLSWGVFYGEQYTPGMFVDPTADLVAAQSSLSRAKDNYLHVATHLPYSTPTPYVKWFDDTYWGTVLSNIEGMAQVAKDGGLRGILHDEEEYGRFFWSYSDLQGKAGYEGKTAEQVATQVRQRGREFAQAINAGFAGAEVLSLRGYGSYADQFTDAELAGGYANLPGGLSIAFRDGMLEASDEDTIFIDGNARSHQYSEPGEFAALRYQTVDRARLLLSQVSDALYRQKVRVGFKIYLDYNSAQAWNSADPEANVQTPARLEKAVRHAIDASDGYVWMYSEYPSWWLDSPDDTFGADSPPDLGVHKWIHDVYREAVQDAIRAPIMDATFDTGAEPSDFGMAPTNISGSGTGLWNQTKTAGQTGYWLANDGALQALVDGPVIRGGATITHTTFSTNYNDQTIIAFGGGDVDDVSFTVNWTSGAVWLWTDGGDQPYYSWAVANTDGLQHTYEWDLNMTTRKVKVFFDDVQLGSSPGGYDVSPNGSFGDLIYLGDATGGVAHSEVWNRCWITPEPLPTINVTFSDGAEPSDFGMAEGGNPGISGSGTGVWNQDMAAGQTGYWLSSSGDQQALFDSATLIHGGAAITHTTFSTDYNDQTIIAFGGGDIGDVSFTVNWTSGAVWLWTDGGDQPYYSWAVANTDGLQHTYEWELNLAAGTVTVFFDDVQLGSGGYDVSPNGSFGDLIYLGDATGGVAHSEVWNRWWITNPEPMTLGLLACGGVLMLCLRRPCSR